MQLRRFAALVATLLLAFGAGVLLTHGNEEIACTDEGLATLLEQFALDEEATLEEARPALFRAGLAYQKYAVQCGYTPSPEELDMLAENALAVMPPAALLQASAVGDDVEAILAEIEDTRGDPINGQLLYNGMEPALDGTTLGCAGCHSEEATAPLTAGTWTRVTEQRLQDPALAEYTPERYLVESIVQPNAYIAPDYEPNQMPTHFGTRLDAQQLADLLAYLSSQDQLLDE